MKKRQLLIMTAFFCCIALVSCKKENVNGPNDSDTTNPEQTHVYVAGSTASYGNYGPAVCWVDGTMQTLDANAYDAALAVCVKGSDVYYGGSNGDQHPVVWKNGTPQITSFMLVDMLLANPSIGLMVRWFNYPSIPMINTHLSRLMLFLSPGTIFMW